MKLHHIIPEGFDPYKEETLTPQQRLDSLSKKSTAYKHTLIVNELRCNHLLTLLQGPKKYVKGPEMIDAPPSVYHARTDPRSPKWWIEKTPHNEKITDEMWKLVEKNAWIFHKLAKVEDERRNIHWNTNVNIK